MHISQQIAAQAVSRVLTGRNLTLALAEAIKTYPHANTQQKSAATDLSYGTLRFYGEVVTYLESLLEKPLTDEKIRCLLLVSIYQLLHDRANDFTVVNQAVKAAGLAKQKWAKGLVNAVLRNFLRKKDAMKQEIQSHESAFYSYPQWWINKLKIQYPQFWSSILQVGNSHPPMTLRINRRKMTVTDYGQLLSQQNMESTPMGMQAMTLNQPLPVEKIPGFVEGAVSVQDYGAQFAAYLLDIQDGMRVLDACCAPGGKTGHILELANVELTAIDHDADRLARVQSNLNRLHLQAQLKMGDATYVEKWWDGKPFDRILADVPCTASGIVRRHVDIKWLRREPDIASFVAQQAKILPSLWRLLAKGGKLLYVTCSIFYEENQEQVNHFLKNHADALQLPLPLQPLPQNVQAVHGQFIPSFTHDGFFYALLQKN